MTKTDFTIKPGCTVWLHHRPWKAGNEDELQKAGFTAAQKRQQADRGMILIHAKPAGQGKKPPTKLMDPSAKRSTRKKPPAKAEAKT